jgi:hypothetical protein
VSVIGGRDLFEAVAQILWEDWDPIGAAVPADEYDSYVPDVVRLLQDGAGKAILVEHLQRVAREALASEVPDERLKLAATKLFALVA